MIIRSVLWLLFLLTPLSAVARYADFDVSGHRICGLTEDGHVECFASYHYTKEQLNGDPSLSYSTIGVGNYYTCGINKATQQVVCWGDGQEGQLEPPTFDYPVVKLSVGSYHACAIDSQYNLKCWGQNGAGQINVPEPAASFVNVSANAFARACGVRLSGDIECWGQAYTPSTNMLMQGNDSPIIDIEQSRSMACGIREDGTALCWITDHHGTRMVAEFNQGPYNAIFPGQFGEEHAACAMTVNGELDCSGELSSSSHLPLAVSRTVYDFQLVSRPNAKGFFGFDANGRLHRFGHEGSNYSAQVLLDTLNGELEMPQVLLKSAEFYGAAAGVELFFEYVDKSYWSTILYYDTQIYRDGQLLETVDDFGSYMDRTVQEGQTYTYSLRPVHIYGQVGGLSNELIVVTVRGDSTVVDEEPLREHRTTGLRAEVYWFDIELFWDRNNRGQVRNYEIRKDGEFVNTTRGTSWYDDTTESGVSYVYDVIAVGHNDEILGFESVKVQIGETECLP